ncbi:Cof-type HAD-IIB family hydrolase [Candidatus Cetobacterium colombiensis]|uniref:Cof-type HAD-IIB family hydrolase n=1 Tax=Candidatus Cetobacterium colombiensis TaxID=3073100 RepID=A0ABU4WEX7_9FUSO|nr:Cof-type HAD-IIB family hydrolase [Candidatus Cetobacterium colombiensis]MDX8336955.1 Cof-type HAD-IIB family hydrolase [Candidatus Cetobacterium colombiensis]
MKAVALDLDGTLLNSRKEISKENKDILRKLVEKNVEILIVTGRPYPITKKIAQSLEIPVTIICYNGARVVDLNSDEVIYEKVLREEEVSKIIDFCKKNKRSLNLFQNDVWYVEDLESYSTKYYKNNSKLEARLKSFDSFDNLEMIKTIIIDENKILNEIERELKKILSDSVYFTYSQDKYLEILNKDVNKGITLKKVLENKGIEISECIAFGDAHNDLEMLELAGMGVAMGNAHEVLKSKVQYVTDTNDNNGVAKFLKQIYKI